MMSVATSLRNAGMARASGSRVYDKLGSLRMLVITDATCPGSENSNMRFCATPGKAWSYSDHPVSYTHLYMCAGALLQAPAMPVVARCLSCCLERRMIQLRGV